MLLAGLGIAFIVSLASASGDSKNKASTHAYLQAAYVYEQSRLANVGATKTTLEGLASRIGGECQNVLAGAPPESSRGGSSASFARAVAESKREDEQLADLEEELGTALRLTADQTDRMATQVFINTVKHLHWSGAVLTREMHMNLAEVEEKQHAAIPDVCADMRTWVSSDYKTLSNATKALISQREARQPTARRPVPRQSTGALLTRYEDASDRALIKKSDALARRATTTLRPVEHIYEKLEKTLGLSRRRSREESAGGAANATVIGAGRTAVGERFAAKLEHKEPHPDGREPGCALELSISGSGVSGLTTCLSRSQRVLEPSVNCASARLTVTATTLPDVRSVRLHMSNGTQIASRVLFVPTKLGGPVGFYYQVVRGPSPIPVSLTETDAHGQTLRVMTLPHIVECTTNPIKYFPGGVRTLAHDKIPGGPAFAIVGERYRFLGHVYFELKLNLAESGKASSGRSSSIGGIGGTGPLRKVLDWQLEIGCRPHPYVILYSVLSTTGDIVLVRTSGTLQPMQRAPIPDSLHAGGVLIYAAPSSLPSELILRAPSGKTIVTEDLGSLATEVKETCRGEEEGSSTAAAGAGPHGKR
jgi:hypothetical protein